MQIRMVLLGPVIKNHDDYIITSDCHVPCFRSVHVDAIRLVQCPLLGEERVIGNMEMAMHRDRIRLGIDDGADAAETIDEIDHVDRRGAWSLDDERIGQSSQFDIDDRSRDELISEACRLTGIQFRVQGDDDIAGRHPGQAEIAGKVDGRDHVEPVQAKKIINTVKQWAIDEECGRGHVDVEPARHRTWQDVRLVDPEVIDQDRCPRRRMQTIDENAQFLTINVQRQPIGKEGGRVFD